MADMSVLISIFRWLRVEKTGTGVVKEVTVKGKMDYEKLEMRKIN